VLRIQIVLSVIRWVLLGCAFSLQGAMAQGRTSSQNRAQSSVVGVAKLPVLLSTGLDLGVVIDRETVMGLEAGVRGYFLTDQVLTGGFGQFYFGDAFYVRAGGGASSWYVGEEYDETVPYLSIGAGSEWYRDNGFVVGVSWFDFYAEIGRSDSLSKRLLMNLFSFTPIRIGFAL
jgi:hypothetical protein